MKEIKYPDWWPLTPYPKEVFSGDIEDIKKALPDPRLRTKISGAYGRHFWEIASKSIYESVILQLEKGALFLKNGKILHHE